MNFNFDNDNKNRNGYQGNGWSNYQIMVLQQLEDHNELLHNLNKEIVEIKQAIAVSETEMKIWRASAMTDIETFKKQMAGLMYEDGGLAKRIEIIERESSFKEQMFTRSKAFWAGVGAFFVVVVDMLLKLAMWLK